jgi:hypothetical protein
MENVQIAIPAGTGISVTKSVTLIVLVVLSLPGVVTRVIQVGMEIYVTYIVQLIVKAAKNLPANVRLVKMAGMETSVNYLAFQGLGVQEATARSQLALVVLVKTDGTDRNATNNVGTVSVLVLKVLAHALSVFQDFGMQLVHRNVQERVKCVINQTENVCFARTDIGGLVVLDSVAQKIATDVMLIQEYAKNVKQDTGVRPVRRNAILVLTKGVIFHPAYAKTARTDMQGNIATYIVTHLDV